MKRIVYLLLFIAPLVYGQSSEKIKTSEAFKRVSRTLQKREANPSKVLSALEISELLKKQDLLTFTERLAIWENTPEGYDPFSRGYNPFLVPFLLEPDNDLYLPDAYFVTIRVENEPGYGRTGTEDTVSFNKAIHDFEGGGNVIIFGGGPWKVNAGVKHFNLNDFQLTYETTWQYDCGVQSTGNMKAYKDYNHFLTNYPNGANTNDRPKGMWWSGVVNVDIYAYGAELFGTYPADNNGNDPSPTLTQNSWEFAHLIQASGIENVNIHGGYWHGVAGDAINFKDVLGECLVEDVKVRHGKRLGVSFSYGVEYATLRDSDVSFNGRGPNLSTDFGTNTRHNFTAEANKADQETQVRLFNVTLSDGGDSGFGLHGSKSTGSQTVKDLSVIIDGLHLENNCVQVDWTSSGAFTFQGSDHFNENAGGNTQYGDDPYPGLVDINRVFVRGTRHTAAIFKMYEGNYKVKFNNSVFYKPQTITEEKTDGDAVFEWQPSGSLPNNTNVSGLEIINSLVIHDKNEPVIMVKDNSQLDEIDDTVIMDFTLSSLNSTVIDTKNTSSGLIDNSIVEVDYYALGSLPAQTVSIAVLDDTAVESDLSKATVRISRTGSTAFPLAVPLSISSTGTGSENTININHIRPSQIIDAGQSSVDVDVVFNYDNGVSDGVRQFIIEVLPLTDSHSISGNNIATITLKDDPTQEGQGNPNGGGPSNSKDALPVLITH